MSFWNGVDVSGIPEIPNKTVDMELVTSGRSTPVKGHFIVRKHALTDSHVTLQFSKNFPADRLIRELADGDILEVHYKGQRIAAFQMPEIEAASAALDQCQKLADARKLPGTKNGPPSVQEHSKVPILPALVPRPPAQPARPVEAPPVSPPPIIMKRVQRQQIGQWTVTNYGNNCAMEYFASPRYPLIRSWYGGRAEYRFTIPIKPGFTLGQTIPVTIITPQKQRKPVDGKISVIKNGPGHYIAITLEIPFAEFESHKGKTKFTVEYNGRKIHQLPHEDFAKAFAQFKLCATRYAEGPFFKKIAPAYPADKKKP